MPQGEGSQRRNLVLLGAAALLLANVAWLHGLTHQPGRARLSGIPTVNSADVPSYFAWIEQARRGELLFRQLYTTEPHEAALFHPLFLAIGTLARILGISTPAAYHLTRVLLSLLVVTLAWLFFSTCHRDPRARVASLGLLLFSSGIGWLWIAAGRSVAEWPIDLWMPEVVPFLSLVGSPLNLASLALWACIGVLTLRYLEDGGRRRLVALAASCALLACLRPHAGAAPALALASLGGLVVVATRRTSPRRALASGAAILAGVAIGIVPPALTLASGPVFAGWRHAASGGAPTPLAFVAGLCFPLACAALAARRVATRGGVAGPWLLAWIAGVLVLVFVPLGPQAPVARKLLEALPLPLAAVGGAGAAWFMEAAGRRRPALGALAFAALLLASGASSAVVLLRDAQAFERAAHPQVLPACLADALEHLARQGAPEDVVLAPPAVGLLVPAFTGHAVVCCHYDQTLDVARKQREVTAFYAPQPAPRAQLLEDYRVRYVLHPSRFPAPAELAASFEKELSTECLDVWRRRGAR
jgi:hypothetical protein